MDRRLTSRCAHDAPPNPCSWGYCNLTAAVMAIMADRRMACPPAGRMFAPTIATHGTQEQVDEFCLVMDGSVGWCQLFSEPGADPTCWSDL